MRRRPHPAVRVQDPTACRAGAGPGRARPHPRTAGAGGGGTRAGVAGGLRHRPESPGRAGGGGTSQRGRRAARGGGLPEEEASGEGHGDGGAGGLELVHVLEHRVVQREVDVAAHIYIYIYNIKRVSVLLSVGRTT